MKSISPEKNDTCNDKKMCQRCDKSTLLAHISASPTTTANSLTNALPTHLLGDGEQIILAIKPSLWFIVFHSVPLIAVVFLFLAALQYFFPGDMLSNWRATINQILATVIFLRLLTSVLQWSSRIYILTNRRILRIKGIFNIDLFECQLTKIQNTFLHLSWYERMLSLGTIFFATAGSGEIESAWHNINHPLEVNELIQKAITDANRRTPTSKEI